MMKKIVVLGLIILTSCVGSKSSDTDKVDKSKDIVRSTLVNRKTMTDIKKIYNQKDVLSGQIDKVEILCLFFGEYYDNSFRISLSNSEFNIVSAGGEKDIIYIGSDKYKNKLIKYINQFYIDKTNEIVNDVKSKQEQIETDYPFIRVVGEKEKAQIFQKDVTLKNNIEFTPDFIEFYKFLDSFVKEK